LGASTDTGLNQGELVMTSVRLSVSLFKQSTDGVK